MSRLKAEIEAKLAQGNDEPVIKVPPGALIITKVKNGWKVRRVKQPGWRTTKEKYVGWTMRTPSGAAMRCRNVGCCNFLRKYSRDIVCSELCRTLLREWCYIHLDIIEGLNPAEALPMWCRALSRPGVRIKEMMEEHQRQKKKAKKKKGTKT